MLIVAIDFECAGACPKLHFATQFAAVCFDTAKYDGERDPAEFVVSTFSSYVAKPEGRVWEERCVREFWQKHPMVYAKTLLEIETAPSLEKVGTDFVEWVKTLPKPFVLATDCAAFDFVWLSYLLPPGVTVFMLSGVSESAPRGAYDTDPIELHSYFQGVMQKPLFASYTTEEKHAAFGHITPMPHDAAGDALVVAQKVASVSAMIKLARSMTPWAGIDGVD